MIYVKHPMQFDGDGYNRLRRKISDINEITGQFTMEHPNSRRISDRKSGIEVSVPAFEFSIILYSKMKLCHSFLQCEILR